MGQRTIQVDYLPEIHIERAAYQLIGDYSSAFPLGRDDPIPVDEIIEIHFGLLFEMDDLKQYFGTPDVLGATWIKDETVRIDSSLDPSVMPHLEGRYHYTIAHEIGHWVLHRPMLQRDENQGSLFNTESTSTIVCRSSQSKEPIEVQADMFASYLLMPEDRVREAWRDMFGERANVTYPQLQGVKSLRSIFRPTSDNAKWMARRFRVSGQAMQIRLEKLGLISRPFSM